MTPYRSPLFVYACIGLFLFGLGYWLGKGGWW